LPEAIAEYQKAIGLSNGDAWAVASLGHAFAALGRRAEEEKTGTGKDISTATTPAFANAQSEQAWSGVAELSA
jgi:hypothetical protein